MTVTNKRLVEILTTAMEKPEIANALIQRVINTLNQQGQETIAKWIKTNTEHREWYICPKCSHQTPRFKDEWQGLTDEEVKAAWSQLWYDLGNGKFAASDDPARHTTIMFAKEIEAKLKEKNT